MKLSYDQTFSDMYQAGLIISVDPNHKGCFEAVFYDSLEVVRELTSKDLEALLVLTKDHCPDNIGLEKKTFMFKGCAPAEFWFYPKSKKAKEILQHEVEINFVNRGNFEEKDSEFSDYEKQLIADLITDDCCVELSSIGFDDSTNFDRLVECAKDYDDAKLFLLQDHTIAKCSLETYELLKNHFKKQDLFVTSFYFVGGNKDDEWKFAFSDGEALFVTEVNEIADYSFPDDAEKCYVEVAKEYLKTQNAKRKLVEVVSFVQVGDVDDDDWKFTFSDGKVLFVTDDGSDIVFPLDVKQPYLSEAKNYLKCKKEKYNDN